MPTPHRDVSRQAAKSAMDQDASHVETGTSWIPIALVCLASKVADSAAARGTASNVTWRGSAGLKAVACCATEELNVKVVLLDSTAEVTDAENVREAAHHAIKTFASNVMPDSGGGMAPA